MNWVEILLVEDNSQDAELLAEAIRDSGLPHTLVVAVDGAEALDILDSARELPHIIFLDLNLPKIGGIDVLRAIKGNPRLRQTVVIVLTNSKSQEDVAKCYDAFCNAYVRKPLGYDMITDMLHAVQQFWINKATLPRTLDLRPESLPPDSD